MEKRFLAFLAIAFSLLMANTLLNFWLRGPQPRAVEPPAAQVAAENKNEKTEKPAAGKKPADPADVDASQPAEANVAAVPPAVSEPKISEPKAAAVKVPEQWVTLGSADPASRYRMLVTFTNRGAAIRRLEMSSPRYRDIDNRSGYLGHLEAVDAPSGGAMARVVGAGTPAAEAGLQPGDVITKLGERSVAGAADLQAILEKTKPRQQLAITYRRAGEAATATATLMRRPLDVIRPERENYAVRGEELPAGFEDPASFLLTLQQVGQQEIAAGEQELAGLNLRDGNWEVADRGVAHVTFRQVLPQKNLEVFKRYRLAQVPADKNDQENYPAYHLDLEIEVVNTADSEQQVAYRLDGPTGLPIEGWWYAHKVGRSWTGVGLRDMVVWFEGTNSPKMFGPASIASEEGIEPMLGKSLMFAGVDAQYFAAVMLPQKQSATDIWLQETRGVHVGPDLDDEAKANKMLANVTCRLISKVNSLAPGESLTHSYRVFAGPKKPDLLVQYHAPADARYNLSELVYYGWFGPVAKAMLGVLHFFYAIVGNYGIAIILLTVLVRGCMFPLSKKQALNMAKMQELQPEMKRIQEKYKKDIEKRTKAQQELFRKHNYNPMGGCLLMFLQLPIFIGLYRSLMVDVELRQAPLISDSIRWCSNLAAPDMLLDWSAFMPEFVTSGVGLLGLGPYFNILPIITVALFIGQQKMFMPPPADEQQAMQQKLMKYMMVFFGFMFFKVASGLCLYFIASSIWGIAERKLLPKSVLATSAEDKSAEKKPEPAKISSNGTTSSGKKRSKQKRR